MNVFLLIALLIGTQIGLSDVLILPTLVAEHGEGSFLAIYAFLKVLFILPILQAELVAGRLYRVPPFELRSVLAQKVVARMLFSILFFALIFTLSSNLFNTSWALIFGMDGLRGDLLLMRPLDQNLYWFEQSQDIRRIMSFVVGQGILLMLLGGLAWRGIAAIFLILVPLIIVFIFFQLPEIAHMLAYMAWPQLTFDDILTATQHALSSSMAGLFVWYVLGTKLPDQLPTGRVIISVQLVDVLFGMAMLSISWPWISEFSGSSIDAGVVLRALSDNLERFPLLPVDVSLWLLVLSAVGVSSSVPLLLVTSSLSEGYLRHWLLAVTIIAVMIVSGGLVLSHGVYSPLTWYDKTLYEVVQKLGQGVLVPLLTAGVAIWIGWVVWPNKILQQINPHGGMRYFLWRMVLRFVVPFILGLVFVRATTSLITVNLYLVIVWALVIYLTIRLFRWVKKRAILPSL